MIGSGSMVAACLAVEQQLATTFAGTANEVPAFAFGEDGLGELRSPPSVVWVPRAGTMAGAGQLGGDQIATPRALMRRQLTIEAHIWVSAGDDQDTSKDFTAAEDLMNHLVAAMHAAWWGAHRVASESWFSGQSASTKLGVICVLGVIVYLPLVRELEQTVVVGTIPIQASDPMRG